MNLPIDDLALSMGITVVESRRLDISYNAVFYRPGRAVYVRAGLDPVTRACAVAHELGHAYYAHDCSTPQAEREADEWAADHLLHEAEVQRAAYETGFEPAAIAAELGVTPHMLDTWWQLYRTGRTTRICSLSPQKQPA